MKMLKVKGRGKLMKNSDIICLWTLVMFILLILVDMLVIVGVL